MPFNFPDPAVSTTATNPETGAKYQWKADPGKWVLTGGPAEASNPPVTISLLPPEGPQKGDLWIHEESLVEYAWDGTQWFEVGSSCGGGSEEEEEKELYHPFVNSFKLVAPDDYTGKEGTATILTTAYDAGDDSYLSPMVNAVKFAAIDINGRKHESAIVGDTIQLTPENKKEGSSNTLYGALEVTTVVPSGNSTRYDVKFDGTRSVIYTEGDIVHYRIASDGFVLKSGDEMSGTLRLQYLQGWRPSPYGDSDPRINLDNTSYGATLEWAGNNPRISWNETGGILWTGHANSSKSVLEWGRSDVNDDKTSHATYRGAITDAEDLVNKEYVDNKFDFSQYPELT